MSWLDFDLSKVGKVGKDVALVAMNRTLVLMKTRMTTMLIMIATLVR